uniref:Reverse transcriptase domain-containing protein n=1 Tax=Tanacetum cinerariifolium TaxID=118510 RepID=A0A699I2R3_TANCI|nr:reverse transcriptase domain-containing protein [Tanacetum cinerariifolium]
MEGLIEGGGPEGVDDREETPPLTKEQIEWHVSAFKSLIKSHNRKNKGDPIRLDFETVEAEIQGHTVVKGKEVMDEDLRKPFKEARRTPFTRRNVNPSLDPVCQKRRTFSTEKSGVVANQVFELAKAGIVRPVKYPTYISNPVLVKKGDGTWRMCIDFKNLISACPKDYYPLPNIDCKVESVMGFKYKCFLDAYKGYHQIQMAKEDEEKTAFYTDRGTYCYTKMPFGLKNAGATYQRLVDSAFQSQIGRNFKAYVDDIVIKSRDEKMLLADIAKTFDNLKKFNMKLNPKKCSFGVEEGKFLDYVVMSEGVRANPKKTKALADLQHPRTLKEMQSLNGKLASLGRFLAKSSERSLSFLNTLKNITKENKHEYRWTQEAKEAFQQLKKLITELPSLTPPCEKKTLYTYLAVSAEAVSAFNRSKGKIIPRSVCKQDTERGRKKLCSYGEVGTFFDPHDLEIEEILRSPSELGAYNITFIPRNAVKGQVLADFLSKAPEETKEDLYFRMSEATVEKDEVEGWTLFTDGASSPKGSGAAGLRIAQQMNKSNIDVKVDSKLVASQINKTYEASIDSMIKYLAKAREYVSGFKSFSIENIPRNMNQKADVLSKLASVAFNHLTKEVLIEILNERSTKNQEVHTIVEEEGNNWINPIIQCLEEGTWPKDKNKARCLRAKIGQYTMESGVLFKKGYLMPMLRCVGPLQAYYVVREIHMGSYGMHVGPRAVVRKAIRQGYYWPTMHEDAKREVEKYDPCQVHASVPRLPKTLMTPIMAPWSFYQWGMDILRPLPPARGGAKFVIVTIDYITKWIEAKPLVKITGKEVIHFAMDNIICRFGLPWVIVTDNGAQLVNDPFKSWCGRFEIRQMNTSVAHPQANRLVERANRSLMEGIKTRLRREKAGWVDELLNVLWAHRTSIKQSNGETPFSLTYGSEAVNTAKIGIPTYRTLMIREGYNEEEMRLNLDLLQERREADAIREAKYMTKMEQYCNRKVRPAGFRPGDFVLRINQASRVKDQGKLGPKWEGPYRVVEAYENGSYKLQTLEDKEIPPTWYAINLRKCYT